MEDIETAQGNTQLYHLDYSSADTVDAHFLLGQDTGTQARKILNKRLNDLGGANQAARAMQRARQIRLSLLSKQYKPGLSPVIKNALGKYLVCLAAWADGGGLRDFSHPWLEKNKSTSSVTAEELAIFLQEDEVGCQTGAYRAVDGTVTLWHTEEDTEEEPGARFDHLRLFSFPAREGNIATAFIYPDLLPGPSFGWQTGKFAQAVDTLHIRSRDFEDGILPNILAWLSLYIGQGISRIKLAQTLRPFFGGYSITTLEQSPDRVQVEKVEFANDQAQSTNLDQAQDSYIFQTNIVADLHSQVGTQELTSKNSRAWNESRLARTARFMRAVRGANNPQALIQRMLCSHAGGPSAYSNKDVKASFIYQGTKQGGTARVSAGPEHGENDAIVFRYNR